MSHKNYRVYAPGPAAGCRVIRWVAFSYGERKVAFGVWIRTFNERNVHDGYKPIDSSGLGSALPVARIGGAISARQNEIFAGVKFRGGKSRTAGLKEEDRLGRVNILTGDPLAPEDRVERVAAKVKAYEQSANYSDGGDFAVRCYPKTTMPA